MTVDELLYELRGFSDAGGGSDHVFMVVEGRYSTIDRTEPGDGLVDLYLLDKDTV